jgi:hypothetical protein
VGNVLWRPLLQPTPRNRPANHETGSPPSLSPSPKSATNPGGRGANVAKIASTRSSSVTGRTPRRAGGEGRRGRRRARAAPRFRRATTDARSRASPARSAAPRDGRARPRPRAPNCARTASDRRARARGASLGVPRSPKRDGSASIASGSARAPQSRRITISPAVRAERSTVARVMRGARRKTPPSRRAAADAHSAAMRARTRATRRRRRFAPGVQTIPLAGRLVLLPSWTIRIRASPKVRTIRRGARVGPGVEPCLATDPRFQAVWHGQWPLTAPGR